MKDIKGNDINIGDEVAYAPNGAYAGISLGKVIKFTPKKVAISRETNAVGRHMSGRDWSEPGKKLLYYAYPNEILVINKGEVNVTSKGT